jgi:hypothetical protein
MYFGIYRGLVTNNNDTEGKCRIKVKVPQVAGDEELPEWAWPCVPPGWPTVFADHVFTDKNDGTSSSGNSTKTLTHTATYKAPKNGTGVWIMFEGGDREHPVWLGTWK